MGYHLRALDEDEEKPPSILFDTEACLLGVSKADKLRGLYSMRVSSHDALSEINPYRLAGADFLLVFRNPDGERVDVPAKLRLAISRHLQLAFAA